MLKNGMWVVYGLFSTFCRTLLYICTDFISYSSSLFYFWINFVLLVTTSYFNLCYHVYPFMYIYHVYLFMYIYHLYPFLAMYIYHVYPFMYIYHLYPFMYYLSCISLYEYLSCISHIPYSHMHPYKYLPFLNRTTCPVCRQSFAHKLERRPVDKWREEGG